VIEYVIVESQESFRLRHYSAEAAFSLKKYSESFFAAVMASRPLALSHCHALPSCHACLLVMPFQAHSHTKEDFEVSFCIKSRLVLAS